MYSNSLIVVLFSLLMTQMPLSSFNQRTLENFDVINLQRDTLPIISDLSKTQLIILANRNTCKDCYRPMNSPSDYLNQKLANGDIKITFLCRVENNITARKDILNELRLLMPNLVNSFNVFYDLYTDPYKLSKVAETGIFGLFKVSLTPAVVLYRPNKSLIYYDYINLYSYLKQSKEFSIEDMINYCDKGIQ
jgi:hypothetical protein